MIKRVYFDDFDGPFWPSPAELEPYFLAPEGKEWFYSSGNDSAGFDATGVRGTEKLDRLKGRIDVRLSLWGNPKLGVLVMYRRYGGGFDECHYSKGDMSRMRQWVRTLHSDPMPVSLYIPFAEAWKAVKEFLETDGELPQCIAWVNSRDLPANSFPVPHEIVLPGETPPGWLSPEEAAAAIALGQGKS
ncbi:MAG: Imm1 family immunity protein [Hyphomicrobium sp.]|nr:hypothetical protein [Hyphomicrobium sp.]